MILVGGKMKGYPMVDFSKPEKFIKITDPEIIGGMCYTIDDFNAQENYKLDLKK